MGVGDVYSGLQSVSAGAYVDIRPTLGSEASVHNIYASGSISLSLTDGTNVLTFDSMTGPGVYAKFAFHVTYNIWIRVTNTSGSTILIGWDGVYTK
ncbi:MAG: hypothetical protein ACPL3B_01990 [Fervidobacterium sp.]